MTEKYKLELQFLDDSESFCNGVETGILYTKLQCGLIIEQSEIIHTNNIAQILLLAKSLNYDVFIDDGDIDEWSYATFIKITKPKLYAIKKEK